MNAMYPAMPVSRGLRKEPTDAMPRRVSAKLNGVLTGMFGGRCAAAVVAVIAALTLCHTAEAANEVVPVIDWNVVESTGPEDGADPMLSVVTRTNEEPSYALDETIGLLIAESLPRPMAEDPTDPSYPVETLQVTSPTTARPVLIPVRPALSIGGVMLALLAPTVRHFRLRRVFR
jgi:hypothetical protein